MKTSKTYIFDIDGTLSRVHPARLKHIQKPDGLVHFEQGETDWKPDWESFYALAAQDESIAETVAIAKALHESGHNIVYLTGRPENNREITEHWLFEKAGCPYGELYMRSVGDYRPDYEIKKEIYDRVLKNVYNDIVGVFEDRDRVVSMWRKLGLTCYQVGDGLY